MECSLCNAPTRVVETRPHGGDIRRRRECRGCGLRFTTVERHDADSLEKVVLEYLRGLAHPPTLETA